MAEEKYTNLDYSHFLQTLRSQPNRAMEFTDEDLKSEEFKTMLGRLNESNLIGLANSGKYCWLTGRSGAECTDEMANCLRKYLLPPKANLTDFVKPKP